MRMIFCISLLSFNYLFSWGLNFVVKDQYMNKYMNLDKCSWILDFENTISYTQLSSCEFLIKMLLSGKGQIHAIFLPPSTTEELQPSALTVNGKLKSAAKQKKITLL